MNPIFSFFFRLSLNKFVVTGFILLIIGFILIPILIGIPLMVLGSGLLVIGLMKSILNRIPGGKKLLTGYGKMFHNMKIFLKTMIKEGMK